MTSSGVKGRIWSMIKQADILFTSRSSKEFIQLGKDYVTLPLIYTIFLPLVYDQEELEAIYDILTGQAEN